MELNETNYFELKNKKLKRSDIAEQFNIPEWKLKKIISANGWGQKRPELKNEKAFSDYSEESCYWAGFIAADGYISDNSDLQICLNYDDTNHLEKFKNYMNSTHKITSNTDKYYRSTFGFKSVLVGKDLLEKYNITPRKSLTYTLPDLPEKYFKHFLRGYFDGDGGICESFSNKNSKTATIYAHITGSISLISDLQKKLEYILDITGHAALKGPKSSYMQLKYNTNKAKILLDYMYKDCNIYLDRKYSLYNKLIVENNRQIR